MMFLDGLMMENELLPQSAHISRYCPRGKCDEFGRPSGAAFMLRSGEEYLSVDWLNLLDSSSRQIQIAKVRNVLSTRLAVSNSAKIAVLSISSMCGYVSSNTSDNRKLKVIHHPFDNNLSHSGIHNLTDDDSLIADLLAEIIEEVFPATDPSAT
jgi:hypothetical protein